MDEALSIGQLARQFGLNTSAIRYYERAGVLPPPAREGGQRRYGPEAIKRMEVLQAAKHAGLTLQESRLLLEHREAGLPFSEALRELAKGKLPEIESLIARAEETRTWLAAATACACTSFDACSLFDLGGIQAG